MIPLLIQRQDQLRIAKAEEEWQPGDRITYGLHIPKPNFGLPSPKLSPESAASPSAPSRQNITAGTVTPEVSEAV